MEVVVGELLEGELVSGAVALSFKVGVGIGRGRAVTAPARRTPAVAGEVALVDTLGAGSFERARWSAGEDQWTGSPSEAATTGGRGCGPWRVCNDDELG